MRHGNAGIRRRGDARRHARNDLERNPRRGERLRLFASAAEHERIAAFEPHDALAFARELHEQRVDLVLPRRLARAAAFADVVQLDGRRAVRDRRQREQRRIRERVVDDRVAGDEQLAAAQREQAGIARARADEIDDAASSGRSRRARRVRAFRRDARGESRDALYATYDERTPT